MSQHVVSHGFLADMSTYGICLLCCPVGRATGETAVGMATAEGAISDEKKAKKEEKAREKELKKLKAAQKAEAAKAPTQPSKKADQKAKKAAAAAAEDEADSVDPPTPVGQKKKLAPEMAKTYNPSAVEAS